MHPIYEAKSTATTHYLDEKEPVFANGHHYKPVGESYGNISFGKRFVHLVAVIGLLAAAIFIILLAFEFFRKQIGIQIQKLTEKKIVNIHYTPASPKPNAWQNVAKNSFVSQLVNATGNNLFKASSFTWCMEISFKGGILRKQFLLKNENESRLEPNEVYIGLNKIKDSVEKSIENEINLYSDHINFNCIMLYKIDDSIIAGYKSLQYNENNAGTFGSSAQNVDPEKVLSRHGFSFASIVKDDNLIPGEHFQAI